MSLFRKPKKHIQRRVFSAEDDENGEQKMEINQDEMPNTPPAPKIKKSEKKEKIPSKQTLLSFGDEEEGEVFQVKKSSHSKKIMKLLDKERRKKDKDKTEPDIKPKIEEKHTEIVTGDFVMVVKSREQPQILNGRAAICAGREDMSDSEGEDSKPRHKFSRTDNVKVVLESGRIPDAAMIHAARKRRQRARELGQEIPLQGGGEEPPPEKDKGRLVREDDESDEERIDMTVNHAAREKDIRREQFFAAQGEESDHDTDKEMEEWENQQIRKGVTGAQLMAASQESYYGQTQEIKTEYIPDIIHEPGDLKTPESIVNKLRERLNAVKSSMESHNGELSRVVSEREQVEKDLSEQQERAPMAAQRFRFFQEMRGYVTDLVECLDEKVSVIAELEEKALDVMGRQAEKLIERRRQDVRDQAEEVSQQRPGAVRTRPNEDESRVRRAAEREGRRSRRRRAREGATQPKHIEGMSSDDEITDQESIAYKHQRDAIISEAEQVFSDVIEDYATIGSILGHLENWRNTDFSTYTEAYASMCIPKIIGPLIKLSLIFWNPLIESDEIEKHKWFHILMLYGAEKAETEEKLLLDTDNLLVPIIVEKIIIPKLTFLVEKFWDPMSSSQTLRLVGLIGRYIRKYPTLGPDSKTLHQLFSAIVDKLKMAVENDVFIPIFSRTLTSSEAKNPFFQRQFASALKLLRCVSSWLGLVNDKTLKELALGALLNRYLLSGLAVCPLIDAVGKAGLLSHILPRVWLQGDLPELGPFNACVTKLASQLDKENPMHLESIETVTSILKSLRCT